MSPNKSDQKNSLADMLYRNYMGRRNSVRTNRTLDAAWRTVILVVGLTIVGLGTFFLLFPGPGWAVIFVGLIILATEYAWAQRLLNPLKAFTSRLAILFTSRQFHEKRMKVILVTTMVIITLAYAYWSKWGATMQGFAPLVEPIENLFNIEI
ncbi:MAG: TIGR02611 family protein [Burkholderiaceae bacterium]|jgi:uncharacterized protein (TIGR02611 family)|nr:TIGR02611 family protein [Burkholderiaceae bacterium]